MGVDAGCAVWGADPVRRLHGPATVRVRRPRRSSSPVASSRPSSSAMRREHHPGRVWALVPDELDALATRLEDARGEALATLARTQRGPSVVGRTRYQRAGPMGHRSTHLPCPRTRLSDAAAPCCWTSPRPRARSRRQGGVKTHEARTVRLPRSLAAEVGAYLADRPHGPDDLVFTAPLGGPLRESTFVPGYFKPAARAPGHPAVLRPTPHGRFPAHPRGRQRQGGAEAAWPRDRQHHPGHLRAPVPRRA
jgi:hypothetical protein